MNGKLFTRDFLAEGIIETQAWKDFLDADFERFQTRVEKIFSLFNVESTPNEATTESEIIFPVLSTLGWTDYLPQQNLSSKGRKDVPDALLLPNTEAKVKALSEAKDDLRYNYGLAIVEAKRWQRPFDRAGEDNEVYTPSSQLIAYLRRSAVMSSGSIRWGILTNGRFWRLYWEGARSLSEDFIEFDLAALINFPGIQQSLTDITRAAPAHYLKVFFLLFCKKSFLKQAYDLASRTFHEIAIEEGRHWERSVSEDLGKIVFDQVFPNLVASLVEYDPEASKEFDNSYLEEIRRAALTFLYRLLFVFYAEDRNLLPVHDKRYEDYSLRKIREDIAKRFDSADGFSVSAIRYHNQLAELYKVIAIGDRGIGLPPYNGGLFNPTTHPLLYRVRFPDSIIAVLIDKLSRRKEEDGRPKWINYRDLSVQQLGSIYERLLEFSVVRNNAGQLTIHPNIFARRGSGSYYTHDDLVQLIIKETIGPLVEERIKFYHDQVAKLKVERGPKKDRLARLKQCDAAERILDLKVCDPAMGSGHFLVSLVDYLTDRVLETMANATDSVEWTNKEEPYISPLTERIIKIRKHILHASREKNWYIDPAQLDDRHIVRRIILKRVIYGVDKNEMAVELAKVALWLHTFTVGAPLSFLDHHLRCGDSLFGEWIETISDDIERRGGLFQPSSLAAISAATNTLILLSELTDADISEVKESNILFNHAAKMLAPLQNLMDFWQTVHWRESIKQTKEEKKNFDETVGALVSGSFDDPIKLVNAGKIKPEDYKETKRVLAINDLLEFTRTLAVREKFLHWEIAFPDVWRSVGSSRNVIGGFDAVIGNPPWDRMKLQEVEWFAERKPEIAKQEKADDRKKMIEELATAADPIWRDFVLAQKTTETAMALVRDSGQYPLLSKGDINLYSLFVERAMRLIHPQGIVGFLTPSGIASDQSSAEFFRLISTGGRLSSLYDFENKKVFFPDIHASFKFNILIFGGVERQFERAKCAFFLHSTNELDQPDKIISITPADFTAVNPNTGTTPIFRSERDAHITLEIYRRHPILVDRQGGHEKKLWPVHYYTMFHMTNDSHLFKTKAGMENEGYYPIDGNIWKKGDLKSVPLYEGKMVQAYDHRAASVVVNPENVYRPASPEPTTLDQHKDVHWLPNPQFWISTNEVHKPDNLSWLIGFKDVTAPTNMRTMIAAIVPYYGIGNTLPTYLPIVADEASADFKRFASLFLANINSFAWDYIARQKVQGQHLNSYIVEQIACIEPAKFEEQISSHKISDFIREQVLRLTYTAVDMEPFARDMGYDGVPFIWDEEDRCHRLARLDALFFHLYDINRKDAAYILDTFPIVREQDEKQFGRYRTKDMILAYMNALAAGDLETVIKL